MPRISILRLTDPEAVRKAIAEHDELGPEGFRERYGFGEADDYFLVYGGHKYDSKAIAGVAYGIQHGVRVTPRDFSGGERTVAKALERLKFEVTRPASRDAASGSSENHLPAAWETSEMLLMLHWYLQHRSEALSAEHSAVVALSRVLQQRALARGRPEIAQARGPAEVAAQIAGFAALDPNGAPMEGSAPSRAHAEVWSRWAQDVYGLRRKMESILDDQRGTVERRTAIRRELADSWQVAQTPEGYRPQATQRIQTPATPGTTPIALLSTYKGPRRVANRTAAEPRMEDPEAFDRANEAHEQVRGALADYLMAYGFSVYDSSSAAKQHNVDFDLAADGGDLRLVIEAKSMPVDGKAEAGRLRLGLGQVLWYRHRFLAVCREPRVAVLAVAHAPKNHEDWLAACRGACVVLTWPERFEWLVDECRCALALG